MSNKLFQSIIHQMKDTINRDIGVMDDSGTIIACSQLSLIGEKRKNIISELSYEDNPPTFDGFTYKVIGLLAKPDYAVFVAGTDEFALQLASVLAISLGSVKEYSDDKYDKAIFMKNIVTDNILTGDIYVKGRELQFPSDVHRVVLLIRLIDKTDIATIDILQSLFPDKNKDYIINANDTDIALIKEVKHNTETKDLEKLAKSITDTLNSEFYTKSCIGIGTIVDNLKDIARSYKEAQVALEVGKVFDTEKTIIRYDNLGIGRIIYQLPTTLCEMFLSEVFNRGLIESLDQETLYTIQKFFENNLNVSETSRKLFVHRNTLVYRLEKIRRITGLDLREFDHAIVFKVALMVKKYLTSKPKKF